MLAVAVRQVLPGAPICLAAVLSSSFSCRACSWDKISSAVSLSLSLARASCVPSHELDLRHKLPGST